MSRRWFEEVPEDTNVPVIVLVVSAVGIVGILALVMGVLL